MGLDGLQLRNRKAANPWVNEELRHNQHLLRYSCLPEIKASRAGALIPLYIRTHVLRAYKPCVLLVDAVVIQVEH